uniref:placenta-specific protein 9 isoform X2 n=1 Tax=Callithrix jacchus TaxID=9483 RepID=UPI0023DD2FAB|nr:placenta-specific protein 9 isoform X2 [Callithrix jacchus]
MGSQRTPDPRLRRLEPTPSPNPSSSLKGPQEARGLRRRPFPREAPGWHGQRLSSWGLWAPRCPRGVEGPLEGAGSLQPESPEPPRNFGSDLEHFLPGRPGAIRGGLLRADAALLWAGPATCGPCSARWPGWLCSVPRALWLLQNPSALPKETQLRAQRVTDTWLCNAVWLSWRRDTTRERSNKRNVSARLQSPKREKMVEKTVEHLATEVKGLLGLLEELAWNLPPGPFSPAPDLLGEDGF